MSAARVPAAAIAALTAIGGELEVQALTSSLSAGQLANEVRHDAVLALGSLSDRNAVGPLVAHLRSGHSTGVARALAQIGDPRAIDALVTAASSTVGRQEVVGQALDEGAGCRVSGRGPNAREGGGYAPQTGRVSP